VEEGGQAPEDDQGLSDERRARAGDHLAEIQNYPNADISVRVLWLMINERGGGDYARIQAYASVAAIPASFLALGLNLAAFGADRWRFLGWFLSIASAVPLVYMVIAYFAGHETRGNPCPRVHLPDGTIIQLRRRMPGAWIIGIGAIVLLAVAIPVAHWLLGSRVPPSTPQSRIRIRQVLVVGVPNPAGWPVVNVYYDNAGTVAARGVVVRYTSAISSHELPSSAIAKIQDEILTWPGWSSAMAERGRYEMHPGDSGEYTTIPPDRNELARDLLDKFDSVVAGRMFWYIFIAFKYRDESMSTNAIGVTEDCFWF
jgi:hypothetical protein